MKVTAVIILNAVISSLYSLPMKDTRCDPCTPLDKSVFGRSRQKRMLLGKINTGMTKNTVSNDLDQLYKLLNLKYLQEESYVTRKVTETFSTGLNITGCESPEQIDQTEWIICVSNKISWALKDIMDNLKYSQLTQEEVDNIRIKTRRVLCDFKRVIIQTEDNHSEMERKLSQNACEKPDTLREATPIPFPAIESLRVAKDIVQSVNNTLIKHVLGRSMLYRKSRKTRGNKQRRRQNLNKKRKNKRRKNKRRNKDKKRNLKNKNKRKCRKNKNKNKRICRKIKDKRKGKKRNSRRKGRKIYILKQTVKG